MHFCMMLNDMGCYEANMWPQGDYCLFRASKKACPHGFSDGWILWNDMIAGNTNYVGSPRV